MYNNLKNKKIYALKVNSTSEELVIKLLARENVAAICPADRKLTVKKNLKVRQDLVPLLRGYIFIFVDELTDQLHYLIKKMNHVQTIFESEIKWEEVEHLLDHEVTIVESQVTRIQREFKTLYGMMRSTLKKVKQKKVRIFEKFTFLKEEIERKIRDGVPKVTRYYYITREDYKLIFN